MEFINSHHSERFNLQVDTYSVCLDFSSLLPGNVEEGRLDTFDDLVEQMKQGLHDENDRISLSFSHPDLQMKNVDIPFQRSKNLLGHTVLTRFAKLFRVREQQKQAIIY